MTAEERIQAHAQIMEPVEDWLKSWGVTLQDALITENVLFLVIGLIAGALSSWAISRHFYKKSSVEVPEWFKPVAKQLPEQQPLLENLFKLIRTAIPRNEADSNSFGTYFREDNGSLTCQDEFTIKQHQSEDKVYVEFPLPFISPPAVILSGKISCITSKTATENYLILEVTPMRFGEEIHMGYQAMGYWKEPQSNLY
ncbi:hypothetical protein HXW73_01910 [Halomonas sp. SH5A2]|uniref:hypothetical protein n=1 Tax=Halomonas sp. SH5A2 TaxID=2749040 RepID=UPI0016413450|nr:hypothetical protein [Halomonas sp. SH5A2]QNI01790.1 hypothetical protein HXW73_01910 [Halomonas sp. SH5A2]